MFYPDYKLERDLYETYNLNYRVFDTPILSQLNDTMNNIQLLIIEEVKTEIKKV